MAISAAPGRENIFADEFGIPCGALEAAFNNRLFVDAAREDRQATGRERESRSGERRLGCAGVGPTAPDDPRA
jgi:hypothetical protein